MLRAPPLLHPWLRAPLGSDPLGSGARAPCCLPFPLCRRPAGSSPGRDACSILLLRLYGFPGAKNFASVPTSISWPLSPSPRDSPTPWARARTLTHTLTLAGARAHARAPRAAESPADPTLSGAATHTGFQSPRGVLCLRQRRRRQQREPQLQPGRVLQLPARDGVREKRRRRTPRRGEAAPRPAPGSARRAAPAPGTAAPGKQAAAPGPAASLECPGLERGFPGPAPATAPGQRLGGEWAPGRGRGMKLEVRLVGRGA